MATHFVNLVVRDEQTPNNHTMINLLVVLLVLLIVAILLVGGLYFMRQRKRSRKMSELPVYSEKRVSTSSTRSNHRRITIRPSESLYVYQEKQSLIANSSSPPPSPIPEIRITFPEEFDESGKRQSGRVVVVRVGDSSVGLEPVSENLPPYQQSESDRFQSLDLDRIGGLTEKEAPAQRWR